MEASKNRAAYAFGPSTDTALCLIPPRHLWHRIDQLRSLYDKACGKWPPHVNLIYPFVQEERLADAVEVLGKLDLSSLVEDTLPICLDEADVFNHRHHNTLYLRPSDGEKGDNLKKLHSRLMDALGRGHDEVYQPHMTIAQSEDVLSDSHGFLAEKVRLLTPFRWDVSQLAVLVRDCERSCTSSGPHNMKHWGSVNLGRNPPEQLPVPESFYGIEDGDSSLSTKAIPQTAYHFRSPAGSWEQCRDKDLSDLPTHDPERLIVASYNVLAEFEWPPSPERHPGILVNILSDRAVADVLVLEEVTDRFLSFLLADGDICSRYPYSTHGPPYQADVGPLPSLLNVVVMSRFPIQWSWLPFHRKHKGAVVATFPSLKNCTSPEAGSLPLILATFHLSQGLVDGAVVAKKTEIHRLLAHLSSEFQGHPWVIAGDFNLCTSSYSLDMARQRQDISPQSYRYLRGFDAMLADIGLQDAWVTSRVLSGESSDQIIGQRLLSELHEGEQGATFDPLTNELAAKMVGSGLNNRPQRYDRIVVNNHLQLRPFRFNMFGFPSKGAGESLDRAVVSDHWGVRCLLERPTSRTIDVGCAVQETSPLFCRATPTLGGLEEIKLCLDLRGSLPNYEDAFGRGQAVELLERALQCQAYNELERDLRKGPRLILVPVGSFALGVWTPSSDIDCLCIGEISQKTFFSLAKTRLRKWSSEGISILRRVRANSGTMMELNVRGIKFDLQYCSASYILEQ